MNISCSGKKNQNIAGLLVKCFSYDTRHSIRESDIFVNRLVIERDGILFSCTGNDGRVAQHGRNFITVQCRGHDQNSQIIAKDLLNLMTQSKRQISLKAAFMKFIKDYQANAP